MPSGPQSFAERSSARVLPGDARDQPAQHDRLHPGVVEAGEGRHGALGIAGEIGERLLVELDGLVPHAERIRHAGDVVLRKGDAGGHLQHSLDRHPVIGRALQLRQIIADRIVEAADLALGQRETHQGRDEGLGHGPGGEEGFLVGAEAIALEDDPAVLQHDEAGGAGALEIILQRVGGTVMHIGGRCQGRARRQGRYRTRAMHGARGIDLAHMTEGADHISGRIAPHRIPGAGGIVVRFCRCRGEKTAKRQNSQRACNPDRLQMVSQRLPPFSSCSGLSRASTSLRSPA